MRAGFISHPEASTLRGSLCSTPATATVLRFDVISRRPAPSLAPFVDRLFVYERESEHRAETVLPSARSQLLMGAGRVPTVVGTSTRAKSIDARALRRVVGVLFRPAGLFSITGISAAEIADTVVPASDVFGASEAELLDERVTCAPSDDEALESVEAWLRSHLRQPTREQALIARASEWLGTGASVATVVADGGASRSSLMRWFATHVGTTPKRFASIARFQRVVRALAAGENDLADLAARTGYADQAHLCHEFRRFSGRTPTAYRPRTPSEPNHLLE